MHSFSSDYDRINHIVAVNRALRNAFCNDFIAEIHFGYTVEITKKKYLSGSLTC